jgi:hypothetical protein
VYTTTSTLYRVNSVSVCAFCVGRKTRECPFFLKFSNNETRFLLQHDVGDGSTVHPIS